MDEFQQAEEVAFVVDDVSTIIKEAVENTIGGNAYQHNKVNQWTSSVVEQCLSQLTKLAKPFKYIVTCVIMQKNGAGLHTASSCFWDNSIDGMKESHEFTGCPEYLNELLRDIHELLWTCYGHSPSSNQGKTRVNS